MGTAFKLSACRQNTVGTTVSLSCLKQAESSEYLVELSLSSLEHALLASHLPLQLLHTHQLPLCFLLSTLLTGSSASGTHTQCQDVQQANLSTNKTTHCARPHYDIRLPCRMMGRGFLPRKCVYGTRPVSAHPLGAIQCLMLVHAGSQD